MPRIYSLAKELNKDSKELVELCQKAGIHGKGSALASLTDDEVAKLKAYLDNASSRGTAAAPRPSTLQGQKPVRTLPSTSTRRAKSTLRGEPPVAVEDEPATAVETEEVVPFEAAAEGPEAPAEATTPPEPVAAGEDAPPTAPPSPRPPLAATNQGQLRNLAARVKKRDADKRPGDGRGDAGPVIRVAAMPEAKQPPTKSKQRRSEPAPQKPDIKLPVDAIRSAKSGGGALRERVKELEEKRKKGDGKKKGLGDDTADRGAGTGVRGRGRGRTGQPDGEPLTPEKRRRKRQRREKRSDDDSETTTVTRPQRRRIQRTGRNTAAERKSAVVIELPCTVTSFAQAVGKSVGDVLRLLLQAGIAGIMNKHAELDTETAELLAEELGVAVEFKHQVDLETQLVEQFTSQEDTEDQLQPRPPVVTFLGHVDHGKTSLLDRILDLKVVDGEAGGITQHIRAYRVDNNGRTIAFVDTPGHEAFTEMRARGANVTDIAVLVVAADDGVMPQTEEAISHAQAAEVPIVVALNKMDLPGVDANRAMQDLAARELLPSEWGGDTELVRCSAITGDGVEELLDTLLTIAELHEFKANPDREATGTCLEAERQPGRGVVAKVLVQNGTLKVGDCIVCGGAHGRVKAMYDTLNPRVKHEQAPPSTPVNLTGLDEVPGAGDRFYVMDDIAKAREIAETRSDRTRTAALSGREAHVSLANLRERLEEGQLLVADDEVQMLRVIIRADTRGSIEAIEKELTKLDHPEVQVSVLQALVGGVSEADVHLADASDAIIIGFNVVPDDSARTLAQDRGVEIRRYEVIYRITEDLKAALEGMLKPEEHERELGAAWVQKVFTISRLGSIAGCRVTRGTIRREAQVRVRVIRDSTIIGDYPLESLRREKDDAREVREGLECGIKLAGFNDIKEGDVLEAYKIEEVARTL